MDPLHDARAIVRVLTWNLFHGRSLPPAPGGLAEQFAALIGGWEWDVALLQEVPPWWPARLAARAGAEQCTALSSRNSLLALRRMLASRYPELMKSNGGGCNAVLSRHGIRESRALRLRLWPERRVAQLLRLSDGTCVANFHGSVRVPLAEQELEELWAQSLDWAGSAPLVLGGDLNLRAPRAPAGAGAEHVASRDVDHLFACGFARVGEAELLERRAMIEGQAVELSDHSPLRVSLELPI
jgi:endonuclease/exonuclease/phosphatase family metal-dependent hydrolase